MKKIIELTTTRFERKPNTKTVFIETEKEIAEITEQQYKNIVESSPFFRRIGGSETLRKSYTSDGYKVTTIISTSPDRQNRTVREFNIYHTKGDF